MPFSVASTAWLLYATTCITVLGAFLLGYSTGVMSNLISNPSFRTYFNRPSAYQLVIMISASSWGAYIAIPLIVHWGDKIGRRKVLLWAAHLLTIGCVGQSLAIGFMSMVFARSVSGVGFCLLFVVLPVYQCEISPASIRGALVSFFFTSSIVGYSASIWIDHACSTIPSNFAWRIPLAFQAVAGVIFILSLLAIPESPRYLLQKRKKQETTQVLAYLLPSSADEDESEAILKSPIQTGIKSYRLLWQLHKEPLLLAIALQALTALNGINVVSFWSLPLYRDSSRAGHGILSDGVRSLLYILATFPAWFLIDKIGRRPLLLLGSFTMGVALLLASIFSAPGDHYSPDAVYLISVYFAAAGCTWAPLSWLYGTEILPTNYRVRCASFAIAVGWSVDQLVSFGKQFLVVWFPNDRLWLSVPPVIGFFCLISCVVVYFTFPETAGLSLEDLEKFFSNARPPALFIDQAEDTLPVEEDDQQLDNNALGWFIRWSMSRQGRIALADAELSGTERLASEEAGH